MKQAVLPALRADLEMYEKYVPSAGRCRLKLSVSAFGGVDDWSVPSEHLGMWAHETDGTFEGPCLFPGGHFYTNDSRTDVLSTLARQVKGALMKLPHSIGFGPTDDALVKACRNLCSDDVLAWANKTPAAEALVYGDGEERVSFQELAHRIRLVANVLQERFLGGQAGQTVALLTPHDVTYTVCMLGIWHAAAIMLIIEPHFPPLLCKEICEENSTVVAISTSQNAFKFSEVANCRTLVLDDGWPTQLEQQAVHSNLPRANPEDVCLLMHTSGTTGRPKTIAGSNFFIHHGFRAKHECTTAYEDSREGIQVMFLWEVIRPLLFGRTSFLIPDAAALDPQLFVSMLQKHKCNIVLTTPSLLASILQVCSQDMGQQLALMRVWLTCGEVLPMKPC
jgi:acyl-coenzyme A synthetase/AMP-(fatty) acid ligase